MPSKFTHRVDRYAEAVLDGGILAGPLVRLACERHRRDRARAASTREWFQFSEHRADDLLDFFETCLRLPDEVDEDGDHRPFLLAVGTGFWVFVLGSMFGWVGSDGYRRFREGYIEGGKGCAKTPVLAGVGLFGMTMDGEHAAEIYSAAADQNQAGIMFKDAVRIGKDSPEIAGELEFDGGEHIWQIRHPASQSIFRTFSREGGHKAGPRPHMGLLDELHEHPNAQTSTKVRAGAKKRKQPVFIEITNSGFDRTSICWQRHEHSRKVVEQVVEDDRLFAYVCTLDEGDDPLKDEACWPKTNPYLGVSVTREYLRRQVENATNIPSETNTVLRLNFCVWTQAVSRYFDAAAWSTCRRAVPDAELIGMPCYAGLDLGQSDDFSALILLWELDDDTFAVRPRFWLPQAALEKYPNRPYAEWQRGQHLTITDGNTTDYERIRTEIVSDCRRWGVRQLAYDKRFADQLAQQLGGDGVDCTDTPQGFYLNAAIRRLNELVVGGRLAHGANPVLGWMADNAVVKFGRDQAIRLDKEKSKEKIDGIAALTMAVDRLMKQGPPVQSVYETRGLTSLGGQP